MEASNQIPENAEAPLLHELGLLADLTRCRMLAVLDGVELTVAELCDSLALPQSTVSRHLKLLADAAWVAARRDGTSRYYGLTLERLDEPSRALWELVRASLGDSRNVDLDRRRRERVLDRRRLDAAAFFSDVADDWDRLRGELFGATSDLQLLPALLDPDAVVGDLGCGSGRVAAALAPFVARVVGVDASPQMLAVARDRVDRFGNVELRAGTLEQLPLEDASLDLALVVHVLHHVGNPREAFAELARVLRPGARLVVADMLPHPFEEYRRTMGHVWLGFDRASIESGLAGAGLRCERWHELEIEPGARGPAVFVASGRRPQAAVQLRDHRSTREGRA
jgi:ArsR family transcriptional regulator